MRKAERAWFLDRRERRVKPESERDFLAGEISRVFETLSLSSLRFKPRFDILKPMKKNQQDEAIIKPVPLMDFSREKIIYIPVDSPSLLLQKAIKKHSLKEKKLLFGHLALLKDKTILSECMGAPLAVLSLERLIASGAKEIIMLGFCGSLNPDIQVMKVASIQKSFSEEGTSKHYFARKSIFNPSPILKKRTENTLSSMKLPFFKGTIVSTDAPYRETNSEIEKYMNKNVITVDMEASALFAVAEFREVEMGVLFTIGDFLFDSKWEPHFLEKDLKQGLRMIFKIARDVLLK